VVGSSTRHIHAMVVKLLLQIVLCFPCLLLHAHRKVEPEKESCVSGSQRVSSCHVPGASQLAYLRLADIRNLGRVKQRHCHRVVFFQRTSTLFQKLRVKFFVFEYCRGKSICQRRRPMIAASKQIKYSIITNRCRDLRQRTHSSRQLCVVRDQTSEPQASGGKILVC
jgi:hypothetical protein